MSPGSRLDDGHPWMVGLIFGTTSGWAGATRGKNKMFWEGCLLLKSAISNLSLWNTVADVFFKAFPVLPADSISFIS